MTTYNHTGTPNHRVPRTSSMTPGAAIKSRQPRLAAPRPEQARTRYDSSPTASATPHQHHHVSDATSGSMREPRPGKPRHDCLDISHSRGGCAARTRLPRVTRPGVGAYAMSMRAGPTLCATSSLIPLFLPGRQAKNHSKIRAVPRRKNVLTDCTVRDPPAAAPQPPGLPPPDQGMSPQDRGSSACFLGAGSPQRSRLPPRVDAIRRPRQHPDSSVISGEEDQ
jgi:hypothetical protein